MAATEKSPSCMKRGAEGAAMVSKPAWEACVPALPSSSRKPSKGHKQDRPQPNSDQMEGSEAVERSDSATARKTNALNCSEEMCNMVSSEELDLEDPDVSFLTVGGYIYFRAGNTDQRQLKSTGSSRRSRQSLMGAARPVVLDMLVARSIRFSPCGALQFSAPRRWEPAWTERLIQQGRFQPITPRKWLMAGARYVCWLRPDEPMPDSLGRIRLLAHHGGFAFLFHDLDEPDIDGRDCYFQVVPKPDLAKGDRSQCGGGDAGGTRAWSSLPFSLAMSATASNDRQLAKTFQLARRGRWALVRHLLAEYPHFATAQWKQGVTLLHVCADRGLLDAELLMQLKELGARYDAQDEEGRTPEALGESAFKALARSVWQVSPDLFEDPEGWFQFWDRNSNGLLEPDELGNALSSAYRCDDIGTQWVKSYVNIHHSKGIYRSELLGAGGLLQALQVSEEFASLREQKRPPLFHGSRRTALTQEACLRIAKLESRLERLRADNGWDVGKAGAPRHAMPLPLPAPSPEGSADPEERMRSARGILGFSFEQTRGMTGRQWQTGFRIDYAGQEGLDDGGLTKAWVSEIGFALWGDAALFDQKPQGSFFKPDDVETLQLDGVPVQSNELYRWTGRFVAYALYQRCLVDCRLCAWCFRMLQRSALQSNKNSSWRTIPDWPDTPEGEDAMLDDLASLDHTVASNLWRVRHELSEDDLQWLDFTCAGVELEPEGSKRTVAGDSKAAYVRLCCSCLLRKRSQIGLQAFVDGFFEVLPPQLLAGVPEEAVLCMLSGRAEVTAKQLDELERMVVPGGLVPTKLREHPRVRQAAGWFFRTVREGDGAFRARLLEFWLGVSRIPLAGITSIRPRPRLQIMVQPAGGDAIKRISSWPKDRLPEGHTCGNELWMALPDSFEEASNRIRLAVENFEAGFALR
eukprot:TRINITY_DN31331_c0_g1_i1.p1 TRINITY_DN31331_c0_g1~~TRINITY_DN31331_c0_g1_i1.p1  ORF type:complete len:1073 (+),score=160.91 TRINITY_DN31331_c0_g1_i1:461-3220(+)